MTEQKITNNTFILLPPNHWWLKLICTGNRIYLPKEHKVAHVGTPYYNMSLSKIGHIGIIVDEQPEVLWHTTIDGKGFDGSQILLPIENEMITEERYYELQELDFIDKYIKNKEFGEMYLAQVKDMCEKHKLERWMVRELMEIWWDMDSDIIRTIETLENKNLKFDVYDEMEQASREEYEKMNVAVAENDDWKYVEEE